MKIKNLIFALIITLGVVSLAGPLTASAINCPTTWPAALSNWYSGCVIPSGWLNAVETFVGTSTATTSLQQQIYALQQGGGGGGGSTTILRAGNPFILVQQTGVNATVTPESVLSLTSSSAISFSAATGTGITASFATTSISQWVNDVGYITASALSGYSTSTITIGTSTSAGVFNVTSSGNKTFTITIPPAHDQYYAPSTTIPTNNNQLTNGAGYVFGQGNGVSNDCVKWSNSSTITDAGAACGAGGGSATSTITASGTTATGPAFTFGTSTTITPYVSGTIVYWLVPANTYYPYSSNPSNYISSSTANTLYLQIANNLSDLANTSTARTNIGYNTGTNIAISSTGTIGITGVIAAANGGTGTTTALGTCAFLNTCGSGGGGLSTITSANPFITVASNGTNATLTATSAYVGSISFNGGAAQTGTVAINALASTSLWATGNIAVVSSSGNVASISTSTLLTELGAITTSTYNASITIATAAPLGGGGSLTNNGTLNLTCTGCLTSAVTSANSITGALILAGTAHEVIVASSSQTITLSTPQGIDTTSIPQFAGLTITGTSTFTGTPPVSTSSALIALGATPQSLTQASGTYISINTISSSNADYINFENNSSSKFEVASSGALTAANITNKGVVSALVLNNGSGLEGTYGGSTDPCSANQAPTTLSGVGALGGCTSTFLTGNQTITLTGDVTGSGATSIAATVAKIQGKNVTSTAPTDHQIFVYVGANSDWEPANIAVSAPLTIATATGSSTSLTFACPTCGTGNGTLGTSTNLTTNTLPITTAFNTFDNSHISESGLNEFINNSSTYIGTTSTSTTYQLTSTASTTKSYVEAGSSTVAATIGGTLGYSVTSTGNGAGASTSIETFNIPTSTFLTVGDEIDIFMGGTASGTSATNKQLQLQIASTTVYDSGNSSDIIPSVTSKWFLQTRCVLTAVTTTLCVSSMSGDVAATSTAGNQTVTVTSTIPINITLFGNGTNASDVIANYARYVYAPF